MTCDRDLQQRVDALEHEIERLRKVNSVLMNRVERSLDSNSDAYSLFETNILLQRTIDERTAKLRAEVAERERFESELRASRRKLLMHIQQTPLGVIEWDLDFRVLGWNPAAEKMFGYTSQEAMGHRGPDLILPPSERPFIDRVWAELLHCRRTRQGVNRNHRKDGTELTCHWYNTPLVDEDGLVVSVASMVQDVTASMAHEQQKQERLDRVQRQRVAIGRLLSDERVTSGDSLDAVTTIIEIVAEALDVSRIGVWRFESDRNLLTCQDGFDRTEQRHCRGGSLSVSEHAHFFHAVRTDRNVSCEDVYSDPRTSGVTQSALVSPDTSSLLVASILVSGEPFGLVSVEHRGPARQWQDEEVAFVDEISGLISQVYLAAERHRSEQQKRQLQDRLERAERMESLGILAGGVAHDLNNILGPIVGYPDLIVSQIDPESTVAKQVTRIGKSAQDAADVIQDLLTLARRGRYEMIPIDLNDIVRHFFESTAFHGLRSRHPDVDLVVDLDASAPKIEGSTSHLSKVVMNLVVNAFDAIDKHGRVTVTTTHQHIDSLPNGMDLREAAGVYVKLSVADDGKGIEADDLAKIFEPYYSKKKMGGSSGTGLGLSVVYGVVKDHKGFYHIDTSPGQGTDFQLFLPATTVRVGKTTTEDELPGGAGTILVVDDSPDQREIATALLERLGYKVRTAASGEEAIEMLKSSTVDLVLLDMIMDPGIDGLDTYRQIVELHPGQKAIIASGFSATHRVEQAQKLGAGRYLRKPYNLRVLGEAVREELAGAPQPAN